MAAWNRTIRWATGKPQPGRWLPGWPNSFCNSGVSGMEQARAVHDEDPMAVPAAIVVAVPPAGAGQQRFGEAAEQPLEDPQGEPLPRLAEGRAGERLAAAAGHVVQCGVLVEDLEREQMDRIGGVEEPILPGVASPRDRRR